MSTAAAADVVVNIDVLPQVFPRYTTPFRAAGDQDDHLDADPVATHRSPGIAWLITRPGPTLQVVHVNPVVTTWCATAAPVPRAGWGSAMGKLNVTSACRNLTRSW